jgi:hypothetical protein
VTELDIDAFLRSHHGSPEHQAPMHLIRTFMPKEAMSGDNHSDVAVRLMRIASLILVACTL